MSETSFLLSTSPPLVDSFRRLVLFLNSKVSLFGESSDVPPVPPTMPAMKTEIENNKTNIPAIYQKKYAQPLLDHWDSVVRALGNDMTFAETLGAPVYQHHPGNPAHKALHRYQVISNDLYKHFLLSEKREHFKLPLLEITPPIAMFQKSGRFGPFTIPVDDTQQLFSGSVAVVSLPGTYMHHPILWAALAHEVGGHDILHADAGLIDEIGRVIEKELTDFGAPSEISQLWKYWIDETGSDVYGVLNYGPAFTINLAFLFSVLNIQAGGKEWMRTTSSRDSSGRLDPHPTDLLRMSLGRGVINNLSTLSEDIKKDYLDIIDCLTVFLADQRTQISIEGIGNFDLKDMQKYAEKVGELICSTKLEKLGGHAIQEIYSWGDRDEKIMKDIMTKLKESVETISGGKGTGHPFQETNHVLSAGTMIIIAHPEMYANVTTNVEDLLDKLAEDDKIWHNKIKRKLMFIKGERRSNGVPVEKGEGDGINLKRGFFSFW